MNRDGHCMSLWQRGTQAYISKTLRLPTETEVLIIGGGITGLTTGLMLQKAGKKCVLAEARNIGFGTTGGTTAHLNTVLDTPYYQIEKNFGEEAARLIAQGVRNAIELISRNVEEYDIECGFKKLPGYIFSHSKQEDEELEKIQQGNAKAGVESSYTTGIPLPVNFSRAIEFNDQAQFHPAEYIYALAGEFEAAGGKLVQECRITETNNEDDFVEVISSAGRMKAQKVIYATHIPPGVNLLHFYCTPYRSYALALKLKDSYPDGLVYDMAEPYHYYRTQEINGEKFLIAGGADHKTGHEEDTQGCFTRLEMFFSGILDIESVQYRWSSQYFEPADGLPYIGLLPGNGNNIYVATGFGGNGMIYGTLAAMVLSDIICNGYSEFEDLLNPNRVKLVAGFENIAKSAGDVIAQLTGNLFEGLPAKELLELKRGEAKLIKKEGQTLAVYKDGTGELHALNSACTHIKCNVRWNSAEKSWDCPCHGSRFSYTGELLTAPARKNLEAVKLSGPAGRQAAST